MHDDTKFAVERRRPDGTWSLLFHADRDMAAHEVAQLRERGIEARYRYDAPRKGVKRRKARNYRAVR